MCLSAQTTQAPSSAIHLLPPAISDSGDTVVFGSSMSPDGIVHAYTDIYIVNSDGRGLRTLTNSASSSGSGPFTVTISPAGGRVAYAVISTGQKTEDVHAITLASGADAVISTLTDYTDCTGAFPCIRSLHFTYDGSRVLYNAGNGLFLANVDGSGNVKAPFAGRLDDSPQRVLTQDNRIVYSAGGLTIDGLGVPPSFVMSNLDGSSLLTVATGSCPRDCAHGVNSAGHAATSIGGRILFEYDHTNPSPPSFSLSLTDPDVELFSDFGYSDIASLSVSGDGSRAAWSQSSTITLWSSGALDQVQEGLPVSSLALNGDGSTLVYQAGQGRISVRNLSGSLDLFAPHALTPRGMSNSANLDLAPSPGSLAAISGINLSGASVRVNGALAPIQSVSSERIVVLLPQNIEPSPAHYQSFFADGSSTPEETATIAATAPLVFTLASGSAAAFHAGTARAADFQNPAKAGDVLEIYGTGLGSTNPTVPAGQTAPFAPLALTNATPQVTIGSKPAQVLFSGLTPGTIGVYQVNVIVPEGLPPGFAAVVWGSGSSGNRGVVSPSIYVQ